MVAGEPFDEPADGMKEYGYGLYPCPGKGITVGLKRERIPTSKIGEQATRKRFPRERQAG